MSPFADRRYGPTSIHEPFPSSNVEREKDICGVLMECFWPAHLWTILIIGGIGIRLPTYQANLVARQFGLSLLLPKTLIPSERLHVYFHGQCL